MHPLRHCAHSALRPRRCFGGFITALFCWLILGDAVLGGEVTVESNADVNRWRLFAALGAGAIFNVANALLVLGIHLAGLSIAFPLGIGTALVLGTTLTYFVDSADGDQPDAGLLFGGVALGFAAVVAIAAADRLKQSGGYGLATLIQNTFPHLPVGCPMPAAFS